MPDIVAAPRIYIEVLKSKLHYDPGTGVWTWLVSFNNGTVAGSRAGDIKRNGYRHIGVCGKRYLSSRLAWFYMTGKWPEEEIDHINGCPSDDRWSNLRAASRSQNLANTKLYQTSSVGFKGVTRNGIGGYMAQITVNRKRMYLGTYRTPEKAHEAYKAAAKKYFGRFSRSA